ncbi:uncharacterized protein LOC117332888 [Pecten maximus]|uniref:uncharacterized protein LOC117332888 n=1 Tax=Pecten maximus TaxID=6579 RepID=UPI001458A0BF|nr:uncharacterized protein LOC117332888 [Pecten maximus]
MKDFEMDVRDSEQLSVLMSKALERNGTGTKEEVDIRRKTQLVMEQAFRFGDSDIHRFYGGSRAEGFYLTDSDYDRMLINRSVTVTRLGHSVPPNNRGKTLLYMREEGCRPGYVNLMLGEGQLAGIQSIPLKNSLVETENGVFASSDMYREQFISALNQHVSDLFASNGPSCATKSALLDIDLVYCFQCDSWPLEAKEWITRSRLYGWPHQRLIDKIVLNGCHIVPVGDKCSDDTLLQWRISFISAERMLVHSFNHVQFKVYFLLKYFLKQLKDTLKEVIGDDDILCSYFLKTVLFYAMESSDQTFWQDKNLFNCFWFCFNILIAWVRAGYCPNYFIPTNNMFKKKICGNHQQILLTILTDNQILKLDCLRFGTGHTIVRYLCHAPIHDQLVQAEPVSDLIIRRDTSIVQHLRTLHFPTIKSFETIVGMFNLFLKSESAYEDVLTYYYSMHLVHDLAVDQVCQVQTTATSNKAKYNSLKKSKHLIIPRSSMGTDLLYLATFYFQTGNLLKSLELCKQTMVLAAHYLHDTTSLTKEQKAMYSGGHGDLGIPSVHKLQTVFTACISFEFGQDDFCLPHLRPEISKKFKKLDIPPLPYAVFLSFMCYHEFGDIEGRKTALRELIVLKYDHLQGGHKYWIVHTLLGICYQSVGDKLRAIRCYEDSARIKTEDHEFNPAMERIDALRDSEDA